MSHQSAFSDYHFNLKRRGRKIAKEIKSRREYSLRRDNEQKEKDEKERVKALKAQDFDCYL